MNIGWWYNIVARKLNQDHVRLVFLTDSQRREIEECRQQSARLAQANRDVVKKLNEIALEAKRLREQPKFRDPSIESALSARDHAASQRIRDLEAQCLHDSQEIARLRARLAKFNQR